MKISNNSIKYCRASKEKAVKLVQKTLNINFAREVDRCAAYAVHIGTTAPTQIRPELQILRAAMETRAAAAKNTQVKAGLFDKIKNFFRNEYKKIQVRFKHLNARRRLLKASEGTGVYSSKINDARKYAQVQGDNFIFY